MTAEIPVYPCAVRRHRRRHPRHGHRVRPGSDRDAAEGVASRRRLAAGRRSSGKRQRQPRRAGIQERFTPRSLIKYSLLYRGTARPRRSATYATGTVQAMLDHAERARASSSPAAATSAATSSTSSTGDPSHRSVRHHAAGLATSRRPRRPDGGLPPHLRPLRRRDPRARLGHRRGPVREPAHMGPRYEQSDLCGEPHPAQDFAPFTAQTLNDPALIREAPAIVEAASAPGAVTAAGTA